MMSVAGEDTIMADINPIMKANAGDVATREYEIILHTAYDDIKADLVDTIEYLRDFSNNVSDYIIARFHVYGNKFSGGFNNRDNLEITINYTDGNDELVSNRYKFLMSNHTQSTDADISNRQGNTNKNITRIQGQCVMREVEALRTEYVEGIYKNVDIKDVIQNTLVNATKDITVEGGPLNLQIDITEPDNDKTFKHIIVPTGTLVLDFPSFLQNTNYGVYNGNIGTYVTYVDAKPTAFVYPLYNDELYEESDRKLMIFIPTTTKLNKINNTYMTVDGVLKIIGSSEIKSEDKGDNEFSSTGDTVVASNPYLTQGRNAVVKDDKISFDSSTQVTGDKIKDKKDGVDRQIYVGDNSNLFKVRSDLNKAKLAVYSVKWNSCDINLLIPGMPCCLIYYDDKRGIVELPGIVQSAYQMYSGRNKSMTGMVNISVRKAIDDTTNEVWATSVQEVKETDV